MIAGLLATAALFWGVPPAQPVEVSWDSRACGLAYACSVPNSYRIELNPGQWPSLSDSERCAVVVHEYGHAVVGTLWTQEDVQLSIPATCHRFAHPPKKGNPLSAAELKGQLKSQHKGQHKRR